ncbi:hypothetical protein [Arthrobacter flavus]|uniref:Antitoxin Xre/MbcA/ParS-like toxin-binding domain-containing protein n=1 Tax=Arthrobacter flavus TaxID=95172 RepID=A0ABW4Q6W1_9MICC
MVRELSEMLTARIVAGLAGVRDPLQVCEWAEGSAIPPSESQSRLRFAYEVLSEIQMARRTNIAQAWALTVNPRLSYLSPVKAIREGRFTETKAAAKALLEDAYDG